MRYPTKEEILSREIFFDKDIITTIRIWKSICYKRWKKLNNIEKSNYIWALLTTLKSLFPKDNQIKVVIIPDVDDHCEINIETNVRTIYLNKNKISIITAFHELAHAIYGADELTACRWSVWLFAKTFHKSYTKLKWKGHMLVK